MDSQKKEVYQATAEVLGLCLKHFANQDHQIVVLNIVRDQLQKLKKLAGARSQEKFMNCLYMVFQHFPDIVEQFASTFVYDMAHVPKGVCLKQAVEMLQGALPYFRYLSLNCNICRSARRYITLQCVIVVFRVGDNFCKPFAGAQVHISHIFFLLLQKLCKNCSHSQIANP